METPATTATDLVSISEDTEIEVRGGDEKTPDYKNEKENSFSESEDQAWSYKQWLRNREENAKSRGLKRQRLALTWNHLEVIGIDSKAAWMEDVFSYVNPVEYIRNWTRTKSTMVLLTLP